MVGGDQVSFIYMNKLRGKSDSGGRKRQEEKSCRNPTCRTFSVVSPPPPSHRTKEERCRSVACFTNEFGDSWESFSHNNHLLMERGEKKCGKAFVLEFCTSADMLEGKWCSKSMVLLR